MGKKVGGYDQSILHKKASGDWLGTNVMMDTQREFTEKVSVFQLIAYSAVATMASRPSRSIHLQFIHC